MEMTWLLMCLNVSVATLNATLQLLVIYRFVFHIKLRLDRIVQISFSKKKACPNFYWKQNRLLNQWLILYSITWDDYCIRILFKSSINFSHTLPLTFILWTLTIFFHPTQEIQINFEWMDYYLVFLLILPLMWLSIRVLTSKLASQTIPPGPKPFPIIGNLFELSYLPHRDLAKLSKTYGPLMTLKLGSITTIVISSPNLAKEALQKNDQAFSSRTIPDMARVFDRHEFSVGWLPTNSKWKNLRKACATQIFATQLLDATQALRQTKVQELIDHVNQSCQSGSPIDIGRVVFTTVLNSISNTFFSMDMAQYDSQLSQEFQDLVCGVAEEMGRPNIADYFPALWFLDPQGVSKRTRIYYTQILGIFDGIIKQRLQSRASSMSSEASNDVLDSLLNLIEDDNSEISLLDIKHLLMVIDFLFKTLV